MRGGGDQLERPAVHQPAVAVHQKVKLLEEIDAEDGEGHRRSEKSPVERCIAQLDSEKLLPPALDRLTASAAKRRPAAG
jgi:hypothetical protein